MAVAAFLGIGENKRVAKVFLLSHRFHLSLGV
jgi:hypothetical protein